MADGARQDVLGQKATAARRAHEARAMSPAKALRRALSRTADVLWDLALVTHGVTQEMMDQDGVVDSLPASNLLLLLDGPDGAVGLVAMDREVMTGLIEVQTILQVTQMPIEERPLTATDAAMAAPLLDGAMERMARYLEGHPLLPQLAGYRFGAMIEDARAAGLLLDAAGYRAFRVSIDLALGRRKGELLLILPDRPKAELPGASDEDPATEGPHEQKMLLLPASMDAILCRINLPLRDAQALKPGDLLPLPPEVLDGVDLLAGAGRAVAGGRLGQMNGMRAVRLVWPKGASDTAATTNLDVDLSGANHGDGKADTASPPEHTALPAGPPMPEPEPEEISPDALSEDLPDLPPMEFDTGDFAFDAAAMEEDDGSGADLDFDFASAPIDLDEN